MRIGIMGGTFDPIHKGHIKCAEEVQNALNLDKVLFIPTGEPPHKIARRVASAEDRLEMVRRAICGCANFDVSDIEIRRNKYTYTYDTLVELNNSFNDCEFYMIIGADTLADIINWHRAEDVFKLCKFIAMKRPGADYDMFQSYLKKATDSGAEVLPVEINEIDISSTLVREKVKNGEDISGLVPLKVSKYIEEKGIYSTKEMSYDEISADMKKFLSPQRYEHCLNVAEECVRLGKIYGADESKCRLAGILHDVGKELTDKQYHWLGVNLSNDDFNGEKVLRHALAGKIIAEGRYGISDCDILEAIESHITGKPNMGLLAKLIFIADYTEKGRVGKQFDEVRAKVNDGKLDEAILLQCDNTLIYNLMRGSVHICTQTVKTRNWALSNITKNGEV